MRRRTFRRAVRSSDFTARNAGWNSTVTRLLGVAAVVARVAGGLRARQCVCRQKLRRSAEALASSPELAAVPRGSFPSDPVAEGLLGSQLPALSVRAVCCPSEAGRPAAPALVCAPQPAPSGWTLTSFHGLNRYHINQGVEKEEMTSL